MITFFKLCHDFQMKVFIFKYCDIYFACLNCLSNLSNDATITVVIIIIITKFCDCDVPTKEV